MECAVQGTRWGRREDGMLFGIRLTPRQTKAGTQAVNAPPAASEAPRYGRRSYSAEPPAKGSFTETI